MIEGLNEGRIKVRLSRELQDKLLSLASLWGITADQAVRELISREVLPGRGLAAPRIDDPRQPTPDQHGRLIRG